MMSANGAIAMASANSANDTGLVFLGLYLMLFALILFLYELMNVVHIEYLDQVMKKNFGFLYGTIGRCTYLMLYVKCTILFLVHSIDVVWGYWHLD